MVLYNEKIKHLSCSDLRVFLKRLVKDKIEKEWTEDFIDNMNLVIIPRMTIKRRYENKGCLLYTSPSPRDATLSRMPSSA